MRVYRLSKARYAVSAFSGEGARLFSGRWNPAGVPMVYTASSLALAAMELFVHLDPTVAPDDLVMTSAHLPETLKIELIAPGQLPENWSSVGNEFTRHIGAEWVSSSRSAALRVPSVAVPGDWNILLNPAHVDFGSISIDRGAPWHFDQRLFRKKR